MSKWAAGFDLPDEQWMVLDAHERGAAKAAARVVAERGGKENKAYARLLLPEFREICDQGVRLSAGPMAVMVPTIPLERRPLIPVIAYVAPQLPPEAGRSMEAVKEVVGVTHPYHTKPPELTEVELPLGPACRLQEVVSEGEGPDGRPTLREQICWFVLPEQFPDDVLEFTVFWSDLASGPVVEEMAERMAASLGLREVP
ncbi:hypothetical protein GCM10027160_25550 [Streptomyces calidiresistens]|uniref:Uncharacterized protein n=1 Tax=Streptomyces calidiresistens TaxID=1485586 RepID=A0A7W3T0Q1_9ACTN|nr:hypothetical protein [Streptomyces calidiresistens]MBB0228718.1 hypothetical protein [Streptomyces calidiresistens]